MNDQISFNKYKCKKININFSKIKIETISGGC